MKKLALLITLCFALYSCSATDNNTAPADTNPSFFIKAADISSLPEIQTAGATFFTAGGVQQSFTGILRDSGVNTIRLRLWVHPENEHSGFNEVKQFAQQLKAEGFKIWLTVHYSDTWADPGQQQTPALWQNIPFTALVDSVTTYTQKIATQIAPDYIQIGNEINPGMLHPYGDINTNKPQFITLMQNAIQTVRTYAPNTQIIIHYAGIEGANWFFNQIKELDYDIIGLSYYPLWHGKSISVLKDTLNTLASTYNKQMVVAETAYPFTLGYNDYTNNIMGLEEQLILPDYPATPQGQKYFMEAIKNMLQTQVTNGAGFCYWGAELVAWKGPEATNGSSWENQALFNFDNQALPVLEVFKE